MTINGMHTQVREKLVWKAYNYLNVFILRVVHIEQLIQEKERKCVRC